MRVEAEGRNPTLTANIGRSLKASNNGLTELQKRSGVHVLDRDAGCTAFVAELISLRVELIPDRWFAAKSGTN